MNKEYKKKWLTNLRSKKFKQGKFSMRQKNPPGPDLYDAFGLLMDTIPVSESDGWELDEYEGRYYFRLFNHDDGQAERIHPMIRDKLGISNELEATIIDMNDFRNMTFEEIADYLECIN